MEKDTLTTAAQAATTDEFARLLDGPARVTSRYERFEQSDDLLAEARKIATSLDGVIRGAKLAVTIQGRQYIMLEGWQTLGGLLGLGPKTIETSRTIENGRLAYHAVVAIVDGMTGRELARAHGYCGSEETQSVTVYENGKPVYENGRPVKRFRDRWIDDAGKPQEFAILSMSQTRATVKAFAALLRWIPKLSGYEGTAYEEMESVGKESDPPKDQPAPPKVKAKAKKQAPEYVNDEDRQIITDHAKQRAKELEGAGLTHEDIIARCLKAGGSVDVIPRVYLGQFLDKIMGFRPITYPPPPETNLSASLGAPLPNTINYETGEVHE